MFMPQVLVFLLLVGWNWKVFVCSAFIFYVWSPPFFVGQACSRWSHDFHHILAWWRKYLWWFLSNLVFIRCFPMITPFFFFPSSMCSSSLSIFFSLTCYKLVETVTAKFSYQESYITYGVYCQVCTNHLSLYNLMQTHRSAMLAY